MSDRKRKMGPPEKPSELHVHKFALCLPPDLAEAYRQKGKSRYIQSLIRQDLDRESTPETMP